tara:strand:+ start:110 stop:1555 length:1446 start_codon:yes stop_codon:yes gene_type:complete
MLEAQAHLRLKTLLRQEASDWPHHLTLSRLVGRSLRRRDKTLIHLAPCSDEHWWLGLLVPLCLGPRDAVLVLSPQQRRRLYQIELPRLHQLGFRLPCWDGDEPPSDTTLWLMDCDGLVRAYRKQLLGKRQLLLPQVDQFSQRLRRSMSIQIETADWETLRRAHPSADEALMQLHERLTRRLFRQASKVDAQIRLEGADPQALRDLLSLIGPSPDPWPALLQANPSGWASWAELDHRLLQWTWQLKPLEPLHLLDGLLKERPALLLNSTGETTYLDRELQDAGFQNDVSAALREPDLAEPLPLYAPRRQPLPNTEVYADHLLEQSRRLVLGRTGLTVVLLDDHGLRRRLTSELAGEFGTRVMEECTAPDSNGVISARWSWWLQHQDQLPQPEQLIIGLLPIASLECPLTSARVERLKQQGRDWFRTLLLPEALSLLPAALAPLRRSGGRLAILDGRLRGRGWGEQVLQQLEPWVPLKRLLPD